MKINLKGPFACDSLLSTVIQRLYPELNLDNSFEGEAYLLAAGDEILEEHQGGDGAFERHDIKHGQMLFTYGCDIAEISLQAFLISNSKMDEVYSICFLDYDGGIIERSMTYRHIQTKPTKN